MFIGFSYPRRFASDYIALAFNTLHDIIRGRCRHVLLGLHVHIEEAARSTRRQKLNRCRLIHVMIPLLNFVAFNTPDAVVFLGAHEYGLS